MPTFQKRHYERLAQVIREVDAVYQTDGEDGVYSVAQNLADMFQRDNPHFKRALFMAACGMPD